MNFRRRSDAPRRKHDGSQAAHGGLSPARAGRMAPITIEAGGKNVAVLVLIGILVLVVGGCVCVVWASRGGPRWVRGVALTVLTVGEVLRKSSAGSKRSSSGGQDGSDDS